MGKRNKSAFSQKGDYYGMKPKEFAAVLKDLGLSWQSHHTLGAPFKMPAGAKMPNGPDGKPMVIPPMKNFGIMPRNWLIVPQRVACLISYVPIPQRNPWKILKVPLMY